MKGKKLKVWVKMVPVVIISIFFGYFLGEAIKIERCRRCEMSDKMIAAENISEVQIASAKNILADEKTPEPELLGNYRITWYCGCEECNGSNPGVDAHGTPLKYGVVASNEIPQFTHILININGELKEFEVRDRMAKQYDGKKCIDIYTNDHQEALDNGVIYANVYTKGE